MATTDRNAVNWLVETIRVTAFPVAGVTPNPDDWWRAVTGADSETRTVKRATKEHIDEGPFEGGRLRLVVNPLGAMQWQVLPGAVEEIPTEVLNVGPMRRIMPSFMDLVEKWFPMCPASTRLAFGAAVLLPVSAHREGYETLARFLRDSVRIDPASTDLLYRINRQRSSRTVKDLLINRLSTWTVIRMSIVVAQATAFAERASRPVHDAYACRVEVDINTTPSFQGTFEPPVIADVFRELRDLGLEIFREGDVP
jgi:uncharacterized protein (UPF0262 family)